MSNDGVYPGGMMMTRSQMICLFALACAVGGVAVPASGENVLMILVEKSPDPDVKGAFLYEFGFSLAKEAATSCSLTIGIDTFSCSLLEGGWFPEARFRVKRTETQLVALLAKSWVFTWNGESLLSTIAVVKFGSTWIDDFPSQPTITSLTNDGPSRGIVCWEVDPDLPGSPDISYFAVDVVSPPYWDENFGLGPDATECSFDLPGDGVHTARVAKVHKLIGNVSTDVQIQQGSWDYTPGGGWFQYWCIDQCPYGVWGGISTQEMSWSSLKALYR
jgi:hypothetical protein